MIDLAQADHTLRERKQVDPFHNFEARMDALRGMSDAEFLEFLKGERDAESPHGI